MLNKPIDWEFIPNPPDQSSSDDDYYALCNGYIVPEDVLASSVQVDLVRNAMSVLESFFDALRENGIREEM